MTWSLTLRRVEGILVVDMCGKLTICEEKFREFVRRSLQAGERRLVLRLADLSYLDSAGLGQPCRANVFVTGRRGCASVSATICR